MKVASASVSADGRTVRLKLPELRPGKIYELDVSTNLSQWIRISTLTASESRISFTDTNALAEARFYRVIQR